MVHSYGGVDECASRCRGQSTLIAVGTNDFGINRCQDGKCSCTCELEANKNGICFTKTHPGYRLYKYQPTGRFRNDYLLYDVNQNLYFI